MSTDGVRTESLDARDASNGPSLQTGQVVLERYRVERPIGRGGMGEVYEATHTTLGSKVALKLPLGKGASGRGAARLLREAQVAASLDPDRVVRVLDVGVLGDGRPVIVLERLDGETLAERIARTPLLEITDAVDFTIGACLGLSEAHARGIIHRDIKPSNLFLARKRDGTSSVKVLDFGVAALRATEDRDDTKLTDSRAAVGSPPYMAPEQLRARSVDARTDVWGLGVTLFELLTGRLPFDAPSPAAVSAAIVADAPLEVMSLRPEIPGPLAEIVGRCLEKSPDARPNDALDLARALAPFASASARNHVQAASTAHSAEAPQSTLASARAVNPSRTSATGRASATWKRPVGFGLAAATLGLLAWVALRNKPSTGLAPSDASPGPTMTADAASAPDPSAAALAVPQTADLPRPSSTSSESAEPHVPSSASIAEAPASSASIGAAPQRPAPAPRPKSTVSTSAASTPSGPPPAPSVHIMDERKF